MLPFVLSLTLAAGVYLLYDGLTRPSSLIHRTTWAAKLEAWLRRTGVSGVRPRDFLLLSLGVGAGVGVAAQVWLGWPVLSLGGALVGAALPALYYQRLAERRQEALDGALVEAISQLRDAIRAGLDVEMAMGGLARTGPSLLRQEFARVVRDARLIGFAPALAALRDRLGTPLADDSLQALILNDRLGGPNISDLMDRLASTATAQQRVRAECRAAQARQVLTARLVVLVPLIVLLVLRAGSPEYAAFYGTPSGEAWLALCALAVAAGYWLMRRLSRPPQ